MTSKLEHLVDLIFKKLKSYENREIILKKENLNRFINSLLKENWMRGVFYLTVIVKIILNINEHG